MRFGCRTEGAGVHAGWWELQSSELSQKRETILPAPKGPCVGGAAQCPRCLQHP